MAINDLNLDGGEQGRPYRAKRGRPLETNSSTSVYASFRANVNFSYRPKNSTLVIDLIRLKKFNPHIIFPDK